MSKIYLVVNESGNESTVTEKMYKYLSDKKGYTCRIAEPKASKPNTGSTKAEIKAYMEQNGLDYDEGFTKTELLELI